MSVSTQPVDQETLTENLAFADLLVWSAQRPVWQRDALRRLVQNGSLDSEDIDSLVALCLDPKLPHEPLSEAHVSTQVTVGDPVAILRIENPTGINALASNQTLDFARNGVTIIYGDNGSGKSGYVRVLKHACRSRDSGRKILRDVEGASATPQAATIAFARGAIEESFAWKPELAGHADLSSVSIFDSRSANIHVEKTNAVAYIPQPMQVLEALAVACDQIKEKLDAQLQVIAAKTPLAIKSPQLSADTAAGVFVRSLSAKSNVAQLELLAKLTDADTHRLSTLETDLAQDPKRAVATISNKKTRYDEGTAKLRRLVEASSKSAFASRNALKADQDTKAEAAKLASEVLFAASPLPDVGKETWQKLWDAARKYSDDVAYPEKVFPDAKGENELCVLCQQPLGQDAIDRRVTFESFIKGSTKAEEVTAKKVYSDAIAKAGAARLNVQVIRQLANMIATEIGNTELAKTIRSCGIRAA